MKHLGTVPELSGEEGMYWVVQKFVQVFPSDVTDNPNELFGQFNISSLKVHVAHGPDCQDLTERAWFGASGPCVPCGHMCGDIHGSEDPALSKVPSGRRREPFRLAEPCG